LKVILPGGAGHVGRLLAAAFVDRGDDVVILTRSADHHPPSGRAVLWDGRTGGAWSAELDGADVVINLAGRSVDCRYGAENRREILASRVDSVRAVAAAIAAAARPPRVWLQAATATIYAHRYDDANRESDGILGGDEPHAPDTWRFSIDVAKAWERETEAAATPRTRKVILRSAMVMGPERGGVFDVLLRLVRLGLGGAAGDGRQYVSWIEGGDFFRALLFLIERDGLAGAVNVASPNPLPNREFMRILREAWGRSFGLPSPAWLLEIGAFFLRTETELILKSRRVVPERLLASGFRFDHPTWPEAARSLCAAVRAR
jgi:uncharacterized protein (TIGR01777 family)